MAITDIPSKLIERTEALTETKLNVSMELTKIIYTDLHTREDINEKKVLNTFFTFYRELKELVPPPLENVNYPRLYKYLTGMALLAFTITFAYILYLFKK